MKFLETVHVQGCVTIRLIIAERQALYIPTQSLVPLHTDPVARAPGPFYQLLLPTTFSVSVSSFGDMF